MDLAGEESFSWEAPAVGFRGGIVLRIGQWRTGDDELRFSPKDKVLVLDSYSEGEQAYFFSASDLPDAIEVVAAVPGREHQAKAVAADALEYVERASAARFAVGWQSQADESKEAQAWLAAQPFIARPAFTVTVRTIGEASANAPASAWIDAMSAPQRAKAEKAARVEGPLLSELDGLSVKSLEAVAKAADTDGKELARIRKGLAKPALWRTIHLSVERVGEGGVPIAHEGTIPGSFLGQLLLDAPRSAISLADPNWVRFAPGHEIQDVAFAFYTRPTKAMKPRTTPRVVEIRAVVAAAALGELEAGATWTSWGPGRECRAVDGKPFSSVEIG